MTFRTDVHGLVDNLEECEAGRKELAQALARSRPAVRDANLPDERSFKIWMLDATAARRWPRPLPRRFVVETVGDHTDLDAGAVDAQAAVVERLQQLRCGRAARKGRCVGGVVAGPGVGQHREITERPDSSVRRIQRCRRCALVESCTGRSGGGRRHDGGDVTGNGPANLHRQDRDPAPRGNRRRTHQNRRKNASSFRRTYAQHSPDIAVATPANQPNLRQIGGTSSGSSGRPAPQI